ncbi:hypothetical protein A0J61_10987 [Choanephora cucurbitarum]|uniref:Uncharacterized protein n=1 Tax=Choanephora cucurbitarum TaxID=101091 RepID=A0A1C7N0S7_9FUNG|nr:hypothetical protein A0J61_10987 [Choanephora cucurbitarum]
MSSEQRPTIEQIIVNQQAQINRLDTNAQPSEEPSFEQQQHQSIENQLVSQLHSLEIRPDHTWQPTPFLFGLMNFDQSLFITSTLTDDNRKVIIEQYLGMKDIDYQPPDTVPAAAHSMKSHQIKQDRSLKRLQYLSSATSELWMFRLWKLATITPTLRFNVTCVCLPTAVLYC